MLHQRGGIVPPRWRRCCCTAEHLGRKAIAVHVQWSGTAVWFKFTAARWSDTVAQRNTNERARTLHAAPRGKVAIGRGARSLKLRLFGVRDRSASRVVQRRTLANRPVTLAPAGQPQCN